MGLQATGASIGGQEGNVDARCWRAQDGEVKTVKSKHVIKDNVKQKLLLSRARFYRYHRQWDGWNRDKCNAVFDQKLSQQLGVQYYFMFYSVWKFVDLTIDICLSLLHVFQKSTCVCRKLQKCR